MYLLPKIDAMLDQFKGAAFFSTIDLTAGFWQVEMDPENKNLSYGRQLELYGHLGEIIKDMKLMKKTTSKIQVEILDIV
ncbi:hypothetical protein G9A89_017696 [Geosiphon pyriformis]|nr:hypothetical protein G9A89_017696 [Geosiphon pyriformis]